MHIDRSAIVRGVKRGATKFGAEVDLTLPPDHFFHRGTTPLDPPNMEEDIAATPAPDAGSSNLLRTLAAGTKDYAKTLAERSKSNLNLLGARARERAQAALEEIKSRLRSMPAAREEVAGPRFPTPIPPEQLRSEEEIVGPRFPTPIPPEQLRSEEEIVRSPSAEDKYLALLTPPSAGGYFMPRAEGWNIGKPPVKQPPSIKEQPTLPAKEPQLTDIQLAILDHIRIPDSVNKKIFELVGRRPSMYDRVQDAIARDISGSVLEGNKFNIGDVFERYGVSASDKDKDDINRAINSAIGTGRARILGRGLAALEAEETAARASAPPPTPGDKQPKALSEETAARASAPPPTPGDKQPKALSEETAARASAPPPAPSTLTEDEVRAFKALAAMSPGMVPGALIAGAAGRPGWGLIGGAAAGAAATGAAAGGLFVPQLEQMPPRTLDNINHLLYQSDVINIAHDIRSRINQRIASYEQEAPPHAKVLLDEVYRDYEKELYSSKDPAEQARAAFAMAAINIARRYQQYGVIPDFEKLLLALDTNDDRYLDTAEIRAIYNNIAEQTPGMPKLMRPEGFGAWFAELMDQLNTTQKVLLAVGIPLGAIGLASVLISGPNAGNIIMGIGGLGAVLAALTAAGVMPGSRTFDIRQQPAVGLSDASKVIDERLAEAIHLLRTTANKQEIEKLERYLGVKIPVLRARYLTHKDESRGRNMWTLINNNQAGLLDMFPNTTEVDVYNAVQALNNMYYYSPSDVELIANALEGLCYLAATNEDVSSYIKSHDLPALEPKGERRKLMNEVKAGLANAGGSPRAYIDMLMDQSGIPTRAFNDAVALLKKRIKPLQK